MKRSIYLFITCSLFLTSCENVFEQELTASRPTVLVETRWSGISTTVSDGVWVFERKSYFDSLMLNQQQCQNEIYSNFSLKKLNFEGIRIDSLQNPVGFSNQNNISFENPVYFNQMGTGRLSVNMYDENLNLIREMMLDLSTQTNGFVVNFAIQHIRKSANESFLIPFTWRENETSKIGIVRLSKEGIIEQYSETEAFTDYPYIAGLTESNDDGVLVMVNYQKNKKSYVGIAQTNSEKNKLVLDFEFENPNTLYQFYDNGDANGVYIMERDKLNSRAKVELQFYDYRAKKFVEERKISPAFFSNASTNFSVDVLYVQSQPLLAVRNLVSSNQVIYRFTESFGLEPVFVSRNNRGFSLQVQATANGLVAFETDFLTVGKKAEVYLYIHTSPNDYKKILLTESAVAPPICYNRWD